MLCISSITDSIGFVVLNYVNHEETVGCVESILALAGSSPIIVVDNCSPNGSFELLHRRFSEEPAVTVMQSDCNGGYSKGNNVGIRVLRQMGILDVVIATSDTRIESADLVERCQAARDDGIAVVGPYIRGDEPGSANPMMWRLTLRYVAAIHMGNVWTYFKNVALTLSSFRPYPAGQELPSLSKGSLGLHDVYMVHGCFLFLSKHYLSQFPELDEDFFMYGEEDLIAYNSVCRGLRVVYDPSIVVYHGNAKSTSPGEFRLRASAASMATLKRKMPLVSLIYAYIRSR